VALVDGLQEGPAQQELLGEDIDRGATVRGLGPRLDLDELVGIVPLGGVLSASERTRATSVFPTPGSPSRNNAFSIRSARKILVARSRSAK
jgi:hypothetical protein